MNAPAGLTPAEYGRWLASQTAPLPAEALDQGARILAGWIRSRQTDDPELVGA